MTALVHASEEPLSDTFLCIERRCAFFSGPIALFFIAVF